MLPLNQSLTLNTGDVVTTSYGMTMPGTHAAATVTVPTAFTEVDVACTDGTSYSFAVPNRNAAGYETNSQAYTITANDNTTFTSNVYSAVNPGCSNGAPGTTTGTYFFALGLSNPGAGNPGLAGFSTTNGLQKSGVTDPLSVSFNLAPGKSSCITCHQYAHYDGKQPAQGQRENNFGRPPHGWPSVGYACNVNQNGNCLPEAPNTTLQYFSWILGLMPYSEATAKPPLHRSQWTPGN